MKPTYLEMSAFGPFADKTVLPMKQIVSEGVFLIHGATGAGKTTIFDAVSFALFGTASGENRPTDSFRSDFATDETPTYVILEFLHAGNKYRIERRPAYQRKKQRGDGYTESRSEATLNLPDGGMITGYQNVTDKIQELLAMDFRQFKQISMIAQGEFLKLLTVESKERGDIFRKVFHTDEFSRIGKALKERMLKAKRICEDTDQVLLQYYQGIDCPENSEYEEQMRAWKEQPDINQTDTFPDMLEKMVELDKKEYTECQSLLQKTEEELAEYQVMEARILEIEKKRAELAQLQERAEQMKKDEYENERDKRKLFFAKKAVALVRPQREAYFAAKKEKEDLFLLIAEKQKQIELLTRQEENLMLLYHKAQADKTGQEELLGKLERAKKEREELKKRTELFESKAEQEANLQKEQEKGEELRIQMAALEAERGACREQEELLTEIYRQGTVLEREEREKKLQLQQLAEQKKRFESYDGIRKNYERLTVDISEKLELQRRKEKELADLEETFICEQAGMLAEHLHEGEACPVCGSKEHPDLATPTELAPTKEELEQRRAEASALRETIAELSKEAASEKGTMELLMEHLKAPKNGEAVFFAESMEEYEQEQAQRQKELDELLLQIEALVKEQTKCMKAKERLKVLEEEIEAARQEVEQQQRAIAGIHAEIQTLDYNIKQITLTVTVATEEEARINLEKLQTQFEQKKQEITEAETAYYEWDNRRQSEAAVLEQLLEQKTGRAMKEQSERAAYHEALQSAGFDTEYDYEQAVLDEREIEELEHRTMETETRLLKYKERQEFLKREIEQANVRDAGFVRKQLEELTEQKNTCKERSNRLFSRLETNERIRTKTAGQLRIRAQMQKEYGNVYWLSAAANGELPGKDKLPFEQYVQAFYFEQVIYEANLRLKKMSGGRYALLRKKEADNKKSVTGLDLEIMDYYTGKARSVKSLSGGESFKAALALALGLSDTIQSYAGGVIVETMFIDEGFGSLDKDSLEQAVEVLQTLACDHRLVGIISHVEELKECIEKKILLVRGTGGSTIRF